eukprot:2603175-Pyramimonas_sp.AAC.1
MREAAGSAVCVRLRGSGAALAGDSAPHHRAVGAPHAVPVQAELPDAGVRVLGRAGHAARDGGAVLKRDGHVEP